MEELETRIPVETAPLKASDFEPVFASLGLFSEDGKWVRHDTIQTGRFIVNGVEQVQTSDRSLSFEVDETMPGDIDGLHLVSVHVKISDGLQLLLSETLLCTPDQIPGFYEMYTGQR